MIKLNVLEDETIIEPLNRIISSMLPHEQYQPELALDVLVQLEKYILIEELTMEYYVLLTSIRELLKIKTAKKGFRTALTRDVFDNIVTYNIGDLVRNKEVGMEEWLHSNGLPNELAIESTFEMACQKLYERSINLYEVCFSLQQPTVDVMNFMPVLKSAYVKHVGELLVRAQAMILNTSLKDGWKVLSGPNNWLTYTLEKLTALKGRLDNSSESMVTIKSVAEAKQLTEDYQNSLQPLTTWGIPPIDEAFPICKHRLIVLAANEGVGKTTIAINLAGNLLRDNGKFLFLTGETSSSNIWAKLLSNYIYKEFGVYITTNHIADKETLPEDKLKLVHIAESNLANSSISIDKAFNYKTFYTELVSAYERNPYDMVIIDHSLTMKGEGTEYEKVSDLALALRDFKEDYPVACVVLSHLSSIAKETVAKGKMISSSPTKASANLSGEADEIFVVFDNEMLRKQGLLAIQQYKRRDAKPLTDYVVIKKKFNVQSYEWDEQFQNNYGEDAISVETAIQNLSNVYDTDDDYDDLDDDYDDDYMDEDLD